LALADAHPDGVRPFGRADYIRKFMTLSEGILTAAEQTRFLDAAQNLADIPSDSLGLLTFTVRPEELGAPRPRGIFDWD